MIAPLWDKRSPKPKITFADMHLHTEYSLMDGKTRVLDIVDPKHVKGELIQGAEMRNVGFVTATDHGNMYAQAQIASAAKRWGLKHAPACEFYVAPRSRLEKAKVDGIMYYHMCGWAMNKRGYTNLCILQKLSFEEGFYMRPRIDQELLDKYGDGIMWSDACMAGPTSSLILQGKEDEGYKYFMWMLNRFGDNFYMEYQNHHIPDEDKAMAIKIEWANQHGVPIIATIDSHFFKKDEVDAHRALLAISWSKLYDDPTFQGFAGDGYYMLDEDELLDRFPVEYINNTMLLVNKVEGNIIEFGNITPPAFQVPQSFIDMVEGGDNDA